MEENSSQINVKSTGAKTEFLNLFGSVNQQKANNHTNLQLDDDILNEIVGQRTASVHYGLPISDKLATVAVKFWEKDSQNNNLIKKLKEDLKVPQNCTKLRVQVLNSDIYKNKHILPYYKRNDKKYQDMQDTVIRASAAVLQIADLCLEADRNNQAILSKPVVAKAIDAITLLGKANSQLIDERKERLKSALSEDIKGLCDHDYSDSEYLLGDNLAETLKQAREKHKMNISLSKRSFHQSASYQSNAYQPKATYFKSSVKRHYAQSPGSSTQISLNYQGRKKTYSSHTQPPYPKHPGRKPQYQHNNHKY